ncbi:unnamed protein product, partial [Scytosiphon promiscuus]
KCAALILPGGLAAHSTFKLPFGDDPVEESVCSIKAESERARVFRRASLILENEVIMSSKFSPEALNLTLEDLCNSDSPFAGKTLLFGADWGRV